MDRSCAPLGYQVYLLRAWQSQAASPGRPAAWRFSLEDPQTKERRGFGSVEEMLAFLAESLALPAPEADE